MKFQEKSEIIIIICSVLQSAGLDARTTTKMGIIIHSPANIIVSIVSAHACMSLYTTLV